MKTKAAPLIAVIEPTNPNGFGVAVITAIRPMRWWERLLYRPTVCSPPAVNQLRTTHFAIDITPAAQAVLIPEFSPDKDATERIRMVITPQPDGIQMDGHSAVKETDARV